MKQIHNPILPGFNPDPSIVRVGMDYYIATSTFEWFPGVQIHHSRDLIHWRLLTRPLNRVSQLDLRGAQNNYGVWAPCLTYADGLFYLTYSVVRYMNNVFRDCRNYLVTSTDIEGPWSEPVYLKSGNADFSLFHDDDGKKWLVFPWESADVGVHGRTIAIQEYSARMQKTVGPVIGIFAGTRMGMSEGPHLYHIGGYYYLFVAEGGTGYGHAETVARAKSLRGPFEVSPYNPLVTSRHRPFLKLQKAGHADLVQTQSGEWYLAHLCARPLPHTIWCVLGRETALQRVVWTADGWPILDGGGHSPCVHVPAPELEAHPWPTLPDRDDFDSGELGIEYQTPRIPLGEDMMSLSERPGFLRLKGCESLSSIYRTALVVRRQQAFRYRASTCVECIPVTALQSAGLTCYYNTYAYYYLQVTFDRRLGKCLSVLRCSRDRITRVSDQVGIRDWERCYLRVDMMGKRLRFRYSADGQSWETIGPPLRAAILSDEHRYYGMMNFTGAFVGLCCQDLSGAGMCADFDYFEYVETAEDSPRSP